MTLETTPPRSRQIAGTEENRSTGATGGQAQTVARNIALTTGVATAVRRAIEAWLARIAAAQEGGPR